MDDSRFQCVLKNHSPITTSHLINLKIRANESKRISFIHTNPNNVRTTNHTNRDSCTDTVKWQKPNTENPKERETKGKYQVVKGLRN